MQMFLEDFTESVGNHCHCVVFLKVIIIMPFFPTGFHIIRGNTRKQVKTCSAIYMSKYKYSSVSHLFPI